jgi:hypothetical protein
MTRARQDYIGEVLRFFAGDRVGLGNFGFLSYFGFFKILESRFDIRPATFGFAISRPYADSPAQGIKRQRTLAHGFEDRSSRYAPANANFLEAIY